LDLEKGNEGELKSRMSYVAGVANINSELFTVNSVVQCPSVYIS